MKDCERTTCEYYSKWLGQDGILCHEFSGIQYLYSNQRNLVQYGYGNQFDIYALCCKNRAVISYGDAAADRLDAMKEAIGYEKLSAKLIVKNVKPVVPIPKLWSLRSGIPRACLKNKKYTKRLFIASFSW